MLTIVISVQVFSQQHAQLSLEDIYQDHIFRTNTVQGLRWMNDGNYYTALANSINILQYSTATGEVVDTLVRGASLMAGDTHTPIQIGSYQFSADESKILISSEVEKIYRRSSKAINYVYDLNSRQIDLLVDGDKQSFASFSPKGNQVAFVRDNNLYVKNLDVDTTIAITTDGQKNKIINGMADWVYEEELSLSKAFFWSPDGQKIAYLKFDETEVPLYTMQNGMVCTPKSIPLSIRRPEKKTLPSPYTSTILERVKPSKFQEVQMLIFI
ncbi:MAG: hypothetical protein HC819_23815 [Cyclobacteriaceae bacterium]|nr:hypothetical protein [Cyclobacteriaceae bacterium]